MTRSEQEASRDAVEIWKCGGLERVRQGLVDEESDKLMRLQVLDEMVTALENKHAYEKYGHEWADVVQDVAMLSMEYFEMMQRAMEEGKDDRILTLDSTFLRLLQVPIAYAGRIEEANGPIQEHQLQSISCIILQCSYPLCCHLAGSEDMECYARANEVFSTCKELLKNAPSSKQAWTTCLSYIVSFLSAKVSKEDWVEASACHKHALNWLIQGISSPVFGGELLGRLLSLVFPLLDDLVDDTRRAGAQMLRHIVHSVSKEELDWYSQVVQDVLGRALTTREPSALEPTLDCLVTSLAMLSSVVKGELALYDHYLPKLLYNASMSTDKELRAVYMRWLRPIVQATGAPHSLFIVQYLQPLLKVLAGSCDAVHAELLLETLLTLKATVLSAWVRIRAHLEEVFVTVLRIAAICAVTKDPIPGTTLTLTKQNEMEDECLEILVLLHELDNERTLDMIEKTRNASSQLKRFCHTLVDRINHSA